MELYLSFPIHAFIAWTGETLSFYRLQNVPLCFNVWIKLLPEIKIVCLFFTANGETKLLVAGSKFI
jgi:hypothetical protein